MFTFLEEQIESNGTMQPIGINIGAVRLELVHCFLCALVATILFYFLFYTEFVLLPSGALVRFYAQVFKLKALFLVDFHRVQPGESLCSRSLRYS